jgi:hypothetical protein
MPKTIFWPAALAIMGFILLSSNMGFLPYTFWNLWPIILIVVGLGGLITADRDDWLCEKSGSKANKTTKKSTKKVARKSKK